MEGNPRAIDKHIPINTNFINGGHVGIVILFGKPKFYNGRNFTTLPKEFQVIATEFAPKCVRVERDSDPNKYDPLDENPVQGKASDCNNEEDRISNLPESIMSHILSFLPTKYAELQPQFCPPNGKSDLLASIPYLYLNMDDSLPLHPKREAPNNSDMVEEHKTSFVSFMYRVLDVILENVPYTRLLRLNCASDYEDAHIIAWICAVLSRKVQALDLKVTMENPSLLLHSLCGCKMLTSLNFNNHLLLDFPESFCLPNLESLDLYGVEFPNDDSLDWFFTGGPRLEDLGMYACDLRQITVLPICFPSLKGFFIEDCYKGVGYEIELDAPQLDLFMYNDRVAEGYPVLNINSVSKVHIDIGLSDDQMEEPDFVEYYNNVWELGFYNDEECYALFEENMHEVVPVCLSLHLKQFEIWEFGGEEDEVKCITLAPNAPAQVFSDPNVATDIMKKNLSMIIPHNFAWFDFFFSGFVAAKTPFPLTQRFTFMLQTR
ncbi:hypothetical protein RJ639_047263 [Escallonia herrerae]|uniref:F-box/LRR-repeat protein 15/At3g58940/PEG3-like LRR domain-containing protein n=1 Tax=Escallonia herrerae TaxID=1293975 RepID=A0AA89B129_9ASTE|nr:hypothetical protein RJ639_047263 [Escallonia herrerae]